MKTISPRIIYAVLAHNNRPCLEDLIFSIKKFSPDNEIILFNGGDDNYFYQGLDLSLCPYSKPLRHGKLSYFHYGIMKMVVQSGREYDFLVTLDADTLLIKKGFENFLQQKMQQSLYMGVNFQAVKKGTDWIIGRRILYKWHKFAAFFNTEHPFGAFNPCQIFRKEYVDQFVEDETMKKVVQKAEFSKLAALEEIIYPTFAMKINGNPIRNPGSHALQLGRHTVSNLQKFLQDNEVFFIHKVGMNEADSDRRFLRRVIKGTPHIDIEAGNEKVSEMKRRPKVLTRLKDMYIWLFA